MYFRTYGLRNRWLHKFVKSPASEEPSIGKIVNGLKHCFNLNDSTFTIFNDICEFN